MTLLTIFNEPTNPKGWLFSIFLRASLYPHILELTRFIYIFNHKQYLSHGTCCYRQIFVNQSKNFLKKFSYNLEILKYVILKKFPFLAFFFIMKQIIGLFYRVRRGKYFERKIFDLSEFVVWIERFFFSFFFYRKSNIELKWCLAEKKSE